MTAEIIYEGNLRTQATHLQSQTIIHTDAPVDNNGKGEKFSPTDLVATALGSCMLTIMGIAANTHQINITGTKCSIEKIMTPPPRRIGKIVVTLYMQGQENYTEKDVKILEHAAVTCPVYLSLSEQTEKEVIFHWEK